MNALENGRRKQMNFSYKAIAREHICTTLALLAFFTMTAPGADAKPRPVKPSDQPATVVAHIPLSGYPASQMDLRESGGKRYLYIGTHSQEGLTVVDVTDPNKTK